MMLDGGQIADELYDMAAEPADAILHRAVQRLHLSGEPYDWVGIYLLSGDNLILHSYIGQPTQQGRIAVGQGLCGTAVSENRDMNIPDFAAMSDHLTRDDETRSETVVRIRHGECVVGVIDIESRAAAAFAEETERELRLIADALGELVGPRLRQQS
jgi:GAF domain-containing protein